MVEPKNFNTVHFENIKPSKDSSFAFLFYFLQFLGESKRPIIKINPENVESYLTFIAIETSYNNVFKTKVIRSDCRPKDHFSFLWCFPMGLMLCLINQTWCMHYMNTVQFVWNAFVCQLLKSLYDLKYTMYGKGFTKSTTYCIVNQSVSWTVRVCPKLDLPVKQVISKLKKAT